MYALIYYTHTDCADVWPVLFAQTEKYYPDHKKYLFSDQTTGDRAPDNWNLITYDDSLPYQQRIVSCLDRIDDDIVLFHHEDMFLYDEPQYENLDHIAGIIKDGEIDIVKLICGSYGPINFQNITSLPYIYKNPLGLKFAVQPSLCKKDVLRMVYDKTGGENIWRFEEFSSHICDYFDIKTGMTFFKSDAKRGQFHWDSGIYPFFSSAISKGKWNFLEYKDMLMPLLNEHGIDPQDRGTTND